MPKQRPCHPLRRHRTNPTRARRLDAGRFPVNLDSCARCTIRVKRILRPIVVRRVECPVTVRRVEEPVRTQPMSQFQDRITVFGSNPVAPIRTDSQGRVEIGGQIQVSPVRFTEAVFPGVVSADAWRHLPSQEVSLQTTLSYAIINRSGCGVDIHLEISPNDRQYTVDTRVKLDANAMEVVTPLRFLKFCRISYRSQIVGESALFDVYYQAQSG